MTHELRVICLMAAVVVVLRQLAVAYRGMCPHLVVLKMAGKVLGDALMAVQRFA